MNNRFVVVTRHAGLVDWLKEHGISGEVTSHATSEAVQDRLVVGVLPPMLAASAAVVVAVDLRVPPELRGKELSAQDVAGLEPVARVYTTQCHNQGLQQKPCPAAAALVQEALKVAATLNGEA